MEKALGKVESTNDNTAVVLIRRGSMCGESCSNCGMCGDAKTKITAKNEIGAKVGDNVIITLETKKGMKAAGVIYGIPMLILICSILAIIKAGFSEGTAVLTAFIIMALWYVIVFVLDKNGKFKESIYAEITEKRD